MFSKDVYLIEYGKVLYNEYAVGSSSHSTFTFSELYLYKFVKGVCHNKTCESLFKKIVGS